MQPGLILFEIDNPNMTLKSLSLEKYAYVIEKITFHILNLKLK